MTQPLAAAIMVAWSWLFQAQAPQPVVLPVGTYVSLVTVDPLSSKTNVKGDVVRLRTSADVTSGGIVAIPAGTEAVGQVVEARAKGAMGMSGRLIVRPLYLTIRSTIVRLSGAASEKASVTAGAVIGTVELGMPVFTGRSASIPAGAHVAGMIERTAAVPLQ